MIDILFVHPNASNLIYQDLSKKAAAIEPPIWAAMLASHVRIKKKTTEILDCEAEGLNYELSAKIAIEEFFKFCNKNTTSTLKVIFVIFKNEDAEKHYKERAIKVFSKI